MRTWTIDRLDLSDHEPRGAPADHVAWLKGNGDGAPVHLKLQFSTRDDDDAKAIVNAVLAGLNDPPTGTPPESGHMTPERYRHLLEAFDATQGWASEFFAVDQRRARRWAEGKAPIPRSVAMMLETMHNYDLQPEDIETLVKEKQ